MNQEETLLEEIEDEVISRPIKQDTTQPEENTRAEKKSMKIDSNWQDRFKHTGSLSSEEGEEEEGEEESSVYSDEQSCSSDGYSNNNSSHNEDDDDNKEPSRRADFGEIRQKLAALEIPPTQQEIDELLAQYEEYSDYSVETAQEEEEEEENDSMIQEETIMKVLVVGNARCGKTSTIRRYIAKSFSEEYVSTIGADFVEKNIDIDKSLKVSLQLWDIAGQDRFAKLTRAYFREAKGAVIVCDITRENTIDAVMTWKNEIDHCCKDLNHGENIPVVLIANKSDLLEDPMDAMNIGVNMQKCVEKNGILEWFRASAKNGDYVDEAFQFLLNKMVTNYQKEKETRQGCDGSSSGFDSENEEASPSKSDIIRLDHNTFLFPGRLGVKGRRSLESSPCDCN
jgi:small GTP-binding protein